MNNENRDLDAEVNADLAADAADAAAGLVSELQEEVDRLETALATAEGRVVELEAATAPAGDAELRALALTVRTAQRNGHPDASKHLDALLSALSA